MTWSDLDGRVRENTDEWIEQFAKILEKNNIGWAFWPYKKMEKPSAVVSILRCDLGKDRGVRKTAGAARGTRRNG